MSANSVLKLETTTLKEGRKTNVINLKNSHPNSVLFFLPKFHPAFVFA